MMENREIKFRAWDAHQQKMIYFDNDTMWDTNWLNTSFIMQFVGLKDKHGVDIYLKDLHIDNDGDVLEVIQMDCGRYALKMVSNDYIDDFVEWGSIEIIGNTFDNAELIR